MIRTLSTKYNAGLIHDDEASECTIRSNVASFFNCKHGDREHFSFYRGFIIARHTVQFASGERVRRTVLYVYLPNLEGRPGTLHVDFPDCGSVRLAKRHIDSILSQSALAPGNPIPRIGK